jgi:hypothetical protein
MRDGGNEIMRNNVLITVWLLKSETMMDWTCSLDGGKLLKY